MKTVSIFIQFEGSDEVFDITNHGSTELQAATRMVQRKSKMTKFLYSHIINWMKESESQYFIRYKLGPNDKWEQYGIVKDEATSPKHAAVILSVRLYKVLTGYIYHKYDMERSRETLKLVSNGYYVCPICREALKNAKCRNKHSIGHSAYDKLREFA